MGHDYDVIVVGGGLGGSAFAKVMAEHGTRVLLLERELEYKDRVRGEGTFPWGVAELEQLGLYQTLVRTCAREFHLVETYVGDVCIDRRDLHINAPYPMLNWVHNEMEEVLAQTAADAGAEVRRGGRACAIKPGSMPAVTMDYQGRIEDVRARLVVCADGRGSLGRKWGNFSVRGEPYGMLLAGVLLEGMPQAALEKNWWFMNPQDGQFVFLCPQRGGMVRAYAWHPREFAYRYQGDEDLPRFIEGSLGAGAPAEWYSGVRLGGPLATFDGADTWVDHPYKDGIALIGDAAASTDPSYGQGQSLTARDARVLRDQLIARDNWDEAGHAYAAEHDSYFGALHKFTGWLYQLFYANGPAADACRARAFPLLAQDVMRMPDVLFTGPDIPLGETVRRRFFGEA